MLKNPIFLKIIYSLIITSTVSILGGLFCLNFGFNFWITCSFFFISQFVVFYFYGESVKRKNALIEASLELEAISQLKKITADVVCPCDKKTQTTIPIEMNSDNSYVCGGCNKRIGIALDVKTFLKTDPITNDPLVDKDLLQQVEEVLRDPTHNDRI